MIRICFKVEKGSSPELNCYLQLLTYVTISLLNNSILTPLLKYLQHIYDEVGAGARVGQAVVRHAIGGHHLLRIGQKIIHRLRCPDDAPSLECRRVAKVVAFAPAPAKDAVETGADFVRLAISRVTGVAILKNFFAAFRIALRLRNAGC